MIGELPLSSLPFSGIRIIAVEQTLLIGGSKVERILRDKRVAAATLTGSEPAGASVASICGSEIMPTVLELGGSDACIIMPSADIENAVEIG